MGEKGKVLATPFSPRWERSPHASNEQSFDTVFGGVRQDAGCPGAQLSMAAAGALSTMRGSAGMGARFCAGVL